MEDIIVAVVAKIAEYLVDPLLRRARYLFCFNNVVENLPEAKQNLELTQESIKERVKEATNRTEKVEPVVEKWLQDVDKVLEEVQKLEGKIEASKKRLTGRFQYFLAKEVTKKIEKMVELNKNSKFDRISRPTELPGMKYFSSRNFVLFKSTESTYNKILDALKEDNKFMVGLHGMGGSGKTTLVKEVGKKAEELGLFDKVVIAVVSQTPNNRNIQDQIADQLNFKLMESSDIGRAQRLSERFKKGKTLLILDDVWENLDFEAIGIPFNENDKPCTVLLTTRSREVCTSMQCQSVVELSLLTQEEAWDLFKFVANLNDESLDPLKNVAKKIARECNGLPIAIVTVGSTLRDKSLASWELALSRLEESQPIDVPKGLRSPFACLKLSYDNLTSQVAKSLFLLCCIFPEDFEIKVEDLVRFGKAIGPVGTLEKSRREMHEAVNILLDSCLLLSTNKKECVKMHDMVRDVALWIASQKGQPILVQSGKDTRILAMDETTEKKTAISLWDLMDGHLSVDQLNCPTLEVLLLHSKELGFAVPNEYFERMKMIKMLAFIRFDHTWHLYSTRWTTPKCTMSVPQSIEILTNLRTLCLRGYNLGNISTLGILKGLEILDLRGSSFDELPNEIAALKKLKLLDLYNCWVEKSNPYEVLGQCLQLEELYLFLWPTEENSLENVTFARLWRYAIVRAKDNIDYDKYSNLIQILQKNGLSRALCIEGFDALAESFASLSIKDLFLRAEGLHLTHLQGGYKNMVPAMDQRGMNELICLILEYCSEIECLVDSSVNANTDFPVNRLQNKIGFSKLITLRLHHMHGLKEIFCDPSSHCSLKRLEVVKVDDCTQLHNISFPKNSNLCSLKILTIERCQMLTYLLMPSIARTLGLLEEIKISKCSKLKHIISEHKVEGNVDEVSNQIRSSFLLPKLRIIEVEGCKMLESIFPLSFAQSLVSLEEINIRNNQELKYVFGMQKEHNLSFRENNSCNDMNIEINLLALRSIKLIALSNLIYIWPEYCHPRSPKLTALQCIECPRLSTTSLCKAVAISDTVIMEKKILWNITTTFEQLCHNNLPVNLEAALKFKVLMLTNHGLEGIFRIQVEEGPGRSSERNPLNSNLYGFRLVNLPEMRFIWDGPPKLLRLHLIRTIHLDKCPKLKTLFSPTIVRSLPNLSTMRLQNCQEMEHILSDAEEFTKPSNDAQQAVCFPELWQIDVQRCNKMKCLFFNLTARHFPSLAFLEINDCFQIDKVFYFNDDEHEEQEVHQNLKYVKLRSLPNLTEIHQGLKLQHPISLEIVDCPKYVRRSYQIPTLTR